MICFYDFLNHQFKCTHNQSDEDCDVKHDLFVFEVSFKIL